jgi:hypothetical protein
MYTYIGRHIGYFEKNSVLSLCQNLNLELLLTYYWKCYPKLTSSLEEGSDSTANVRTSIYNVPTPTLSVVLAKNGDIVENIISEDIQAKVNICLCMFVFMYMYVFI